MKFTRGNNLNFGEIDSVIKSCRDIMRKDKGMNTDAQRLPQLLWMLFLKCFDDYEQQKEILGDYDVVIEKPYRWRDWSDEDNGLRGEELIEFVEKDLFKYLSTLRGKTTQDQRDIIADIFLQQKNSMTDGYEMKRMIDKINELDFTSSDQYHLIGAVYEKMLLSMRDDSPGTFGEYYTPRGVIKFMVQMTNPSIKNRETILDPACGTAGFLIESFIHLEKQVKNTKDNQFLQNDCLNGIEPRPEPHLYSIMNLMLHGIAEPNIVRANTLETSIRDINSKMQVDVIMTNPPFGGEESASIKKKFPAEFQTQDTALGFFLHCIARLKDGGRCAVILPDGPLFQKGIASKIKKKLMDECNLHTIIRMPKSVFAPYTTIATNILFFEKGASTKEIWIYELPKREGYKSFNKTNPITIENFQSVIDWWNNRKPSDNVWKIKLKKIIEDNYEIDINNPNKVVFEETRSPDELVASILDKKQKMKTMFDEIQKILRSGI